VDLLEEQGLATGQPQPLDVDARRPRFEPERGGHGLAGGLRARLDQARLGVQPTPLHLRAERHRLGEVTLDARVEDGGAASAGPLDPPFAGELGQGAPDGDQAAAVVLRQLAFGRQPLARTP
jgi:hypothetical protein